MFLVGFKRAVRSERMYDCSAASIYDSQWAIGPYFALPLTDSWPMQISKGEARSPVSSPNKIRLRHDTQSKGFALFRFIPNSMMSLYFPCLAAATAAAALLLLNWARSRNARSKFPPGPPGWPVIGNLFDIPKSSEWVKYKEWCDRYRAP